MTFTLPTAPMLPSEIGRIDVGAAVQVCYRKFDGTPHWTHSSEFLGCDEFGAWVGAPKGRELSKPGRSLPWMSDWVVGFPNDRWRTITVNDMYEPPRRKDMAPDVAMTSIATHVYVDMSTVPTWHATPDGIQVHMVDLDLDVIRRYSGHTLIVDEDEFAHHIVKFGYPPEVIDAAQEECERSFQELVDGRDVFATAYQEWLNTYIARIRSTT